MKTIVTKNIEKIPMSIALWINPKAYYMPVLSTEIPQLLSTTLSKVCYNVLSCFGLIDSLLSHFHKTTIDKQRMNIEKVHSVIIGFNFKMYPKTILVLVMMITLNGFGVTVTAQMLKAIATQESTNRNGIVGDKHLKEHSYGMYQIRRPYLADVMKAYKKECIAKWGRTLTLKDMQYDPKMSAWVVTKYIELYGKNYEKKTGKKVTAEIAFRIHNGGPMGWNKKYKKLYTATTVYKNAVMRWYKA